MRDFVLKDRIAIALSCAVIALFILPQGLMSSANLLNYPTPKNLNDYLSWGMMGEGAKLQSSFNLVTTSITRVALTATTECFGEKGVGILAWFLILGSFVFFFRIFRHYLDVLWSLSLSFLSLFCFSTVPFREFIMAVASGHALRSADDLAILSMPFPSISLFCFLGALYFTISSAKVTPAQRYIGTLLWCLQTFIYPVNALFGLPIWAWALSRRYLREKDRGLVQFWAGHVALVGACVLPAAYAFVQDHAAAQGLSEIAKTGGTHSMGETYGALYFALPILLILLGVMVGKIDRYEVREKFGIFYVLCLTELVFMILDSVFLSGMNFRILFSRFFIFVHFLYLVPFLYYIQRAETYLVPYLQRDSSWFAVKQALAKTLKYLPRVALPVIMAAFLIFLNMNRNSADAYRATQNTDTVSLVAECEWAKSKFAEDPTLRAASSLPIMQLCLTNSGHSLWRNHFVLKEDPMRSLKDVASYFKLSGQSFEAFKDFVKPNTFSFDSAGLNNQYLEHRFTGLGWFLIFQQQGLSHEINEAAYNQKLESVWAEADQVPTEPVYFFTAQNLSSDWSVVRSTPFGSWYTNKGKL